MTVLGIIATALAIGLCGLVIWARLLAPKHQQRPHNVSDLDGIDHGEDMRHVR